MTRIEQTLSTLAALSLAALIGCGKGDDSASVAPDVTGRYNVSVDGATGCEDQYEYWTMWANGPLVISGDNADNLLFDFAATEGMDFGGFVDASWTFEFGGEIDWADGTTKAHLSISDRGSFTQDGDKYIGTSDTLDIVVDDDEIKSNNCTVTAKFTATQL